MPFFVFVPSFFIFLYTLYGLVKDDYVFLRKNIKLEQFFDIAIISIACGYILVQFALSARGFSLNLFLFGGIMSLLLIGRYKRLPLGRIFDFFTLSFLTSLPAGFLFGAIFMSKNGQLLFVINSVVYFLLAIFFRKVLLARVMSRTLKEGVLSIFFLLFYSSFTLIVSIFTSFKENKAIINLDIFIPVVFLIGGIVILSLQRVKGSRI